MARKTSAPVARIAQIVPGSIAEELGITPGDRLLSINGMVVSDYIAYRFAIADEEIELVLAHGDEVEAIGIEKDADEDLGLIFASDVFDGVRACRNACVFCFEAQMPTGMRGSLRLRDDDFRLSFLHGNFLTLTNLTDDDFGRIARERLSPLFVSIHATDREVRNAMLQNHRAPDICEQLQRLGDAGIEVHGQIVLCPGWNDGDVLARTLDDLAALFPIVRTVGIVPVGLTAHRPAGPAVRPVAAADAARVLEQVHRQQDALRAATGSRQVFAADEFYLLTGAPLPLAAAYEGFPQKENGIGLARLWQDELAGLPVPALSSRRITLGTGTLAAPLLAPLAVRLGQAGIEAQVLAIPNHFYGGGVSVAGLLTGGDVRAALAGRDLGDLLILPAAMLNADGIFLDDSTPDDLQQALGVPLRFAAGAAAVVEMLYG